MKTIETFSGSEAMKEIEPQREGFSLSVALGSLKKWVCGRREKHGKPFGLTNNSAVEKLEAAGEELGLPETDVRLSSGLKLLMGLMHGKKEVEIIGEDILIEAAKRAKEEGKGSVIAQHISMEKMFLRLVIWRLC